MIKYKDIEFSTIFSQDIIKSKLEKIVCSESIFDKDFRSKELTGYVNRYDFFIHNIKSIFMYRAINYWRVLIKGKMVNDNNLTTVKMRIRIFHGEIIYLYGILMFLFPFIIYDGIKTVIPIILWSMFFIVSTISTIYKIRNIDKEIRYYEKMVIKTIIE